MVGGVYAQFPAAITTMYGSKRFQVIFGLAQSGCSKLDSYTSNNIYVGISSITFINGRSRINGNFYVT